MRLNESFRKHFTIILAFLFVVAGAVALVHASFVFVFRIEMANIVPMITATAAILLGMTLILTEPQAKPVRITR